MVGNRLRTAEQASGTRTDGTVSRHETGPIVGRFRVHLFCLGGRSQLRYNSEMDWFIAFWPLWVLLILVVAAMTLLRMYAGRGRLPYDKRPRLVTKAELRFYKSLVKAVQDDWSIFVMVRIADILTVPKDTPKRRTWVNKILAKHIDFVLCDSSTLEPVVAIELDDRSHERKDRQERDEFVDHAFESAQLPLVRFPVRSSYRAREIREIIDDAL